MKTNPRMTIWKSICNLVVGLSVAMFFCAGATAGHAQALPPGVQDVVRLSRSGISDQVILSQIRNTGATYNLTADQIISLKNQGVSQPVINALLSGGAATPAAAPAPVVVPMPSTPAPAVEVPVVVEPVPTLRTYQIQLAPYGAWVDVPVYGRCWQPAVAVTDPAWHPYFTRGHWIYTETGWSWQSDYPWGDIVFHYGRWVNVKDHWYWVPGYAWAPAWVCWREADGYCGWAPLPPAAEYRTGAGLFFNGRVALDVDFGLGVEAFTFVSYDHFWDNDLRAFLVPHDRLAVVFHGSHVNNGYRVDGGRFVVEGLGHEHIAAVTHHEVRVEKDSRDVRAPARVNYDDKNNPHPY